MIERAPCSNWQVAFLMRKFDMKSKRVRLLSPVCKEHGAAIRDEVSGEVSVIRPLKDGASLAGIDAVSVGERYEDGSVELKVLHEGAPDRKTSSGPAKVSTNEYRSGWERVFKRDLDKSLN